MDRRGLALPALVVLALALTVSGTFLPFFRTEQPVGIEPSGYAQSTVRAWRVDYTFPGAGELSSPSVPFGFALLLASAILLAAAVLGIRQAVLRRPSAAARVTTLTGAAFLAGAVCAIAMHGFVDDGRFPSKTTTLAGMWLLLAAVLAAAAAAVLSHRLPPASRPEWADPTVAFADTSTPPSGVVITVLPPEDD